MLQHGRNVSKIFEQARNLILVVSLDKVVRDLDAALAQTHGMAVFGFESLLLGLHGRAAENGSTLDRLPFEMPGEQTAGPIHVILFDNGRSQLLQGRYRDLLSCIGCRACVRGCAGSQSSEWPGRWSPKEYVHFLALGRAPFQTFCLQCKSCQANCPLGIDLPGMIIAAKADLLARRRPALGDRMLGRMGTLERWGSRAPALANALARSMPVRWLAEKVLDFSRERKLPQLRRGNFTQWFRSDDPDS